MMASSITEKGLKASAILEPNFELLKTHIHRGIFNIKLDLSIKGCIGSKKSIKYAIPGEMNTVEN